MKIFVLILFTGLSIYVNGQTENVEKNAFSLNVMGCSSLGGVTYDRNIGNCFHMELGIGLIGIGAGLNKRKISGRNSRNWGSMGDTKQQNSKEKDFSKKKAGRKT